MLRKAVAIGLCGIWTLVASGCADRTARGLPSPVDAPAPGIEASAVVEAPALSASGMMPPVERLADKASGARAQWIQAIRIERWDEAQKSLDTLDEAERNRAEIKYVRGRVAFERGDAATAVECFTGLDKELPFMADDIVRRRAEAASIAGPYAEAAAFFRTSSQSGDLYRAVISLEKAGQLPEAKALADKALFAITKGKGKGRRDEAPLRAARARITEAQGNVAAAIADFRTLAVDLAGETEGEIGMAALQRLGKPLDAQEKLSRAQAFIRVAKTQPAVSILDELDKQKSINALDVQQVRAELRLRARDYAGAEKAYRALSAIPGPHKQEALYQSAMALARSGQTDAAIKRWLDLVDYDSRKTRGLNADCFRRRVIRFCEVVMRKLRRLYFRYLTHVFPRAYFGPKLNTIKHWRYCLRRQPASGAKKISGFGGARKEAGRSATPCMNWKVLRHFERVIVKVPCVFGRMLRERFHCRLERRTARGSAWRRWVRRCLR